MNRCVNDILKDIKESKEVFESSSDCFAELVKIANSMLNLKKAFDRCEDKDDAAGMEKAFDKLSKEYDKLEKCVDDIDDTLAHLEMLL